MSHLQEKQNIYRSKKMFFDNIREEKSVFQVHKFTISMTTIIILQKFLCYSFPLKQFRLKLHIYVRPK